MEETLISFETAKLAKEKGFKYGNYIYGGWGEFGEETNHPELGFTDKNGTYNNPNNSIYKATQSLLQKWLREVHNVHIVIWQNTLTGHYRVDRIFKNLEDMDIQEIEWIDHKTYESTLELALYYSLKKLIISDQ